METEDTTTTTPAGPPASGRRLTKSRHDRVVAGVAGGLGAYFGVDAVLFRIGFVVLSVAGGSGLALYGLGWLLLPDAGAHEDVGARISRWYRQKPVLAIIGTVIAVSLIANGFSWGGGWGNDNDGFWGVVLVTLGIAFLVNRRRARPGEPTAPIAGPSAPDAGAAEATDPLLAEAADLDPMAGATATSTMWPPSPPVAPVRTRPRPFLTPVTLSLLLIGAGIAALAGVSLQTYLAMALLGVGVVMLIGARIGRARGLLAVGLLLAAASTVATVTDVSLAGGTGDRTFHPTAATQLQPYRLGIGELTIDLRDLEFTGTRTVKARVGLGQLTVLVPPDVNVIADTHVGLGQVQTFGGQAAEGMDIDRVVNHLVAQETARTLRLDLDAGIGEINVEVQ